MGMGMGMGAIVEQADSKVVRATAATAINGRVMEFS
jgi:hypothetical protein